MLDFEGSPSFWKQDMERFSQIPPKKLAGVCSVPSVLTETQTESDKATKQKSYNTLNKNLTPLTDWYQGFCYILGEGSFKPAY